MFGPLGFPELVFILVLALLIFGPKRLPEIGRTIGRGMAEFRKASTDLKRTINTELALDEPIVPPVRPWMEPAAPPVVPANTAANTPANTAARVPPATWLPRSEPEPLEPDDTPDLPLSAAEAQAQSSEAPSSEPLEPS